VTNLQQVIHRLSRRKDADERGFSLIELIIVIVIMGILIAIAIPVYAHIQSTARKSAVDTAASNAASQAAAELAANPDDTESQLNSAVHNLVGGHVQSVTVALVGGNGVDNICATATDDDDNNYSKSVGPGCSGSSTTTP